MASIEQRINTLLSQMSLDEKIAQLGSCWVVELQTKGRIDEKKVASNFKHGIGQITRLAGASTFDPVTAAKTANKLQKYLVEETSLIPLRMAYTDRDGCFLSCRLSTETANATGSVLTSPR